MSKFNRLIMNQVALAAPQLFACLRQMLGLQGCVRVSEVCKRGPGTHVHSADVYNRIITTPCFGSPLPPQGFHTSSSAPAREEAQKC